MATARVIVNAALRKLGVVGSGREPRTTDQVDTLAALQGMYGAWIASGAFGRLTDVVPQGATYTPWCSCRILRENNAVLTIMLPELVSTGWFCDYGWLRCCGDYNPSQPPRDGMVVVITDRDGGQTVTWLYDGSVKAWQRIDLLQLDDEAPRSYADPNGLSSLLATEVSDQFGVDVPATTLAQAQRYQQQMTHRYGMRRELATGVYY